MLEVFLLLIFAHFLADYPLQGSFLSSAKNKFNPVEGTPWYQAMIGHCAIHGGFTGIITGNIYLGLAEFFAHFAIDYFKCGKYITFDEDQALHVFCKVLWTLILLWVTYNG